MARKRYAVVGTGGRGIGMFARAVAHRFKDQAELVGLCDVNRVRMRLCNETLETDVPMFTDFDEMMDKTSPDVVCVTSKDCTHHIFTIKTLESGRNVITEKPMTVDDEKCRGILSAEKASTGQVRVSFNYRYAPYATRVRELLAAGAVGRILSIDFHWYLDIRHGADYFRRWHRRKENSGGLMVHKATHHFDLVNWWIEQDPLEVFAIGDLQFYGPTRKERGERCLTCPHTQTCEFYMDMRQNEHLVKLYLNAEKEDGYFRDRCVFADEIDIEDRMLLLVKYSGGAHMGYTLNAFLPYEGYRIAFNGTEGRLEAEVIDNDPWDTHPPYRTIRYFPLHKPPLILNVPKATGGHGGGDELLLRHLFLENQPDPLKHAAGSRAGAMSILTGVAANKSMASGQPVRIADLLGEHAGLLKQG